MGKKSDLFDEFGRPLGVNISSLKTVSVTKTCEADGAYVADDVISESDTPGAGTAWTFAAMARGNGGGGEIVKAIAVSETTALTPKLTLFLFNATPTCELDDNAANTAVLKADISSYVGKIDFPAMEDLGTGCSEAIVTLADGGNLPLPFVCASDDDDLYGVLVTRDGFDQVDDKEMTIKLTVKQH